ncbi:DUF402 domain-containing protein [Streptomyces hiroshimensis]|uniref:DUF402 domain-containing protein n=1 Tax=Streptomyces hiroshimensis TaxID=66424 RepID=A0ABQ2Z1Y2_9ACTN|nr:DUF402 domain-containing protein [Streptomyces hiroshimensis]GGY00507.1 hypothetical protein GCM10010324_54020 [Streptomyces hiroshimensis]
MSASNTVLQAGDDVTVTLVKESRSGIGYPAVVVRDDGTHAVVRAPWAAPADRDFGFVRFEHGDVFTEHYWRDRWYAVKEVRTADGTLKGWYCDITRPARITPDGIVSTDLDLDLWISADGTTILRLDEDEFEESGLQDRDPSAARRACAALDELEGLARAGGLTELLGQRAAG